MTVANVANTTLRQLKSAKEVRNLFERNVHKPSFYKDTMHLYKINDYHAQDRASSSHGTRNENKTWLLGPHIQHIT